MDVAQSNLDHMAVFLHIKSPMLKNHKRPRRQPTDKHIDWQAVRACPARMTRSGDVSSPTYLSLIGYLMCIAIGKFATKDSSKDYMASFRNIEERPEGLTSVRRPGLSGPKSVP